MRRALLIYNPAAGKGRPARSVPRLLAALSRSGFQTEPAATRGPGDAARLAREAVEAGLDAVFAFGGDGTVRETAVGLMGSRVPLGILPGGTVNVLVRALGLPSSPEVAAVRAGALRPRPFDVGLCGETPFLMMASSGLDAEVMGTLEPRLKARWGQLGVAVSALARWWSYAYPDLRLTADGEPLEGTLAVASNIPLYGGSWRMAPGARWDDGLLDLVLFRGRGRAALVSFGASLALGRHLGRRDVEHRRVREVVLEGPAGARVQVDGDPCPGPLPLRMRISPQPLRVLAPG